MSARTRQCCCGVSSLMQCAKRQRELSNAAQETERAFERGKRACCGSRGSLLEQQVRSLTLTSNSNPNSRCDLSVLIRLLSLLTCASMGWAFPWDAGVRLASVSGLVLGSAAGARASSVLGLVSAAGVRASSVLG